MDADKSAARVAREEAALRRMREVAINDAQGRGVNNDMSGQEVRALAAHLLYNVEAFRPSPARHLTFDLVERLVRQSSVIDVLAPWEEDGEEGASSRRGSAVAGGGVDATAGASPLKSAHAAVHAAAATAAAEAAAADRDAALVDPTQFGAALLRSLHAQPRKAAAQARRGGETQGLLSEGGADEGGGGKRPLSGAGAKRGNGTSSGISTTALLVAASEGDVTLFSPSANAAAAAEEAAAAEGESWLYLRGESSSVCTVILQGTMEVLAGS